MQVIPMINVGKGWIGLEKAGIGWNVLVYAGNRLE